MKYIADRGYTDTVLDRHVEKGAVLEDEYKKDNIELTEERKDYLVNERKLYIAVEEIPEEKVGDITPVDKVPEGEPVIDRVDIIKDNDEEDKTDAKPVEESEQREEKEDSKEETDEASEEESNEEDKKEVEPVVESDKKEENTNVKSNAKTNTKTTKKEKKNN